MSHTVAKITFDDIFALLVRNGLLVESSFQKSKNPKIIEYITYNSRDITDVINSMQNTKNIQGKKIVPSKTLFFCKGNGFKREYLDEVVNAGVRFYVSEKRYDIDSQSNEVEYFIVNDIRTAMAEIASFLYGNPKDKLNIIGITGTKGKTTTAYFLFNILNKNEMRDTALLSSIEVYTGKSNRRPADLSTPEALELHKYFYEAEQNECDNLIMEVSSQGYKTNRVHGVNFKYGIFLNIAEDHISPMEHPDFNDYLMCKLEMFKNCDIAIINRDIEFFDIVYEAARKVKSGRVIVFGSNKYINEVDYYYSNISTDFRSNGTMFSLIGSGGYEHTYALQISGLFNVENAVAAILPALDMGIESNIIETQLYQTKIPGRMEIYTGNQITVIVDYAHNRLSFQKLFESLKINYAGRRIISVGGAVGNKCYNRRKEFAMEVIGNSDFVYLTADDPQYESVSDICRDVLTYAEDKDNQNYEIIEDRQTAIEEAIINAKAGDVVVLLSKGIETTQKVNGKIELYAGDMEIAKKAFLKRKQKVNELTK